MTKTNDEANPAALTELPYREAAARAASRGSTREDVELFLKAATGVDTMTGAGQINVGYNTERLCTAHTCFNQLCVPESFRNEAGGHLPHPLPQKAVEEQKRIFFASLLPLLQDARAGIMDDV